MFVMGSVIAPAAERNPRWPEGIKYCHIDGDDANDRSLAGYNQTLVIPIVFAMFFRTFTAFAPGLPEAPDK